MEQASHHSAPFKGKYFPITIVCDSLSSPANVGSMFRLADAFGVAELIFCGTPVNIKSNRLQRTARNTAEHVPFSFEENIAETLHQQKVKGSHIIGVEITTTSTALATLSVGVNQTVCLVIGNEKSGLQQEVLPLLDACYHIPMYGINSSMNVTHAAAIALYELTSKINNHTLDL